jgi:hypothetical protein
MGLLSLFVAVTALHLRLGVAPECHCFGVLERYMASERSKEYGLWRAMGMLLTVAVGVLVHPGDQEPGSAVAREARAG